MAQGDLSFLEDIKSIDCEKEKFVKIISVFSKFLSRTNRDFYYNETYLPTFVGDFLSFKKYLGMKENIFAKLSGELIIKRQKVYLAMDSCFIYNGEQIEICNLYELKKICSKSIVVKIENQKDVRREIAIIKKCVIENDEILWDAVNEVLEDIIKRVDNWNG